jgi:hypothetical protein
MSDLVAIPQPGQPALASWGADVARAIRSMRLSGGPGIRVTVSKSGTTISAIRQPSRPGSASDPFDLLAALGELSELLSPDYVLVKKVVDNVPSYGWCPTGSHADEHPESVP